MNNRNKERETFGTPFVLPKGASESHKDVLRAEVRTLIPHLFAIVNPEITAKDRKGITRVLEIMKFGGPFSPIAIRFEFEKKDTKDELTAISVWKDPHYHTREEETTVFKGRTLDFPDLKRISEHFSIFQKQIGTLLEENPGEVSHHNIYIVGSKDNVLIAGLENESFSSKQENFLAVFLPPLKNMIHSEFQFLKASPPNIPAKNDAL